MKKNSTQNNPKKNNEVIRVVFFLNSIDNTMQKYQQHSNSSFNYQYHHIKDILEQYPDITQQNLELLTCPEISQGNWQKRESKQWKQQKYLYHNNVDSWLPIFFNEENTNQYFEQQLSKIAILLQINNSYKGFLGYIPNSLHVINIIQAFCQFHLFTLPPDTHFYVHEMARQLNMKEIQKFTIKQLAGNYIKIWQSMLSSIKQKQNNIINQLFLDQEYSILDNYQRKYVNLYEIEDLPMPDFDMETCDLQKQIKFIREKTPTQYYDPEDEILQPFIEKYQQIRQKRKPLPEKNYSQLSKLKNRAKSIIFNPKIELSLKSEQTLNEQLHTIALQIQRNLINC